MEPTEERPNRNGRTPSESNSRKQCTTLNFTANDSGYPITPGVSQIFGGSLQELPRISMTGFPRSASTLDITSPVTTNARSDFRSISEPVLAPTLESPATVPQIDPSRLAGIFARPPFTSVKTEVDELINSLKERRRKSMKKYFNISIPRDEDEERQSIQGSSPSSKSSNACSISLDSPRLSKVSIGSSSRSSGSSNAGSASSLSSLDSSPRNKLSKLDVLRNREKMLLDDIEQMKLMTAVSKKMDGNTIRKLYQDIDKKKKEIALAQNDQQELKAEYMKIDKEISAGLSTIAERNFQVEKNNYILGELLRVKVDEGFDCGDKRFCDGFHNGSCFPTSPEHQ